MNLRVRMFTASVLMKLRKNAVKASFKTPRELDMNLVNAQQTRRMLDRMVGYRISPFLWAKVKRD